MSREMKILSASLVLMSLQLLFQALFTNGSLSRTAQSLPPVIKAASHANTSAAELDSPAKTAGGFVLKTCGELTRAPGFSCAKGIAPVSTRRFIVVPLFFRMMLAPKVSPYISKSVLNI
jgi:hypothetical protein